jgi:2-polyprenyl-3-methyl-5-hydroxy-6-metoxy-1,4-benzoquinol methylase
MSADPAELARPSAWVQRFAAVIPAGGRVLDVACGSGRHARPLAQLGFQVIGVDRDADAIAALAALPASRDTSRIWSAASGRMADRPLTA